MSLFNNLQGLDDHWESFLLRKLKDNDVFSKNLKHNHVPCVGIVPGCDYCSTRGNILQFGPINFHHTDIKKHLFPYYST